MLSLLFPLVGLLLGLWIIVGIPLAIVFWTRTKNKDKYRYRKLKTLLIAFGGILGFGVLYFIFWILQIMEYIFGVSIV